MSDFYLGQNNRKCYENFCNNFCNVDYCKVCSEDGGCLECADGWVLEGDKCTLPDNQCIEGAILYSDYKCYDYDKAPSNVTPILKNLRESESFYGDFLERYFDYIISGLALRRAIGSRIRLRRRKVFGVTSRSSSS